MCSPPFASTPKVPAPFVSSTHMPSGFNSETLSLRRLLSAAVQLTIPDYQRPYSWTIKEAEQLLDDLNLALDEAQTSDATDAGYFLGAVLLMEHPAGKGNGTGTPVLHDIVDGQQRLVTLTILLAVLRDLIADKGGSIESLVQPLIWSGEQSHPVPRISLRGQECEFLRSHVQELGASAIMPSEDALTPGEARIIAVREHLAEELFERDTAELEKFAGYLVDSCHFAVITTSTVDRAHRIFAVLNERGRPLARNDILKAQILGAIDPARRGPHTQAWEQIEHDLGGDFEGLFSHIRAIEDRGRSKVIRGIADLVSSSGGAEAFFDRFLVPYAKIFTVLKSQAAGDVTGQSAEWHTIRRCLAYLGWLGSADWMPAAMLYWRQCKGDPAALAAFLARLDRLAYALRLLGIGADKRRARFHSVVSAIRQDAQLDAADNPLELTRDELRNINYNLRNLHARSQLTCKLVLLRLNDEMAGAEQNLEPGDLTVEHVLPQKPGRNSQWREWFPAADQRETCTQSLGNLILVSKIENDKARNLDFARKCEVYFARGIETVPPITRDVHGQTDWRAEAIQSREARLLQLINCLWRLEPVAARSGTSTKPPPSPLPPQPAVRRRRRQSDGD